MPTDNPTNNQFSSHEPVFPMAEKNNIPADTISPLSNINNSTNPLPIPNANFQSNNGGTTPPNSAALSPQAPEKYGGKKIIATIFGILLLLSSVGIGVYLVQKNAEYRGRASSGRECSHSPDCELLDNPGNSGKYTATRTIQYVYITARTAIKFDQPLTDDGCYRVAISGTQLEWQRHGDGPNCKDISNIQVWTGNAPTTQPTGQPSSSPTQTPGHKIQICHVPPGSSQIAHVVDVDKSAWEAGHDLHNNHNMDFVIGGGRSCPPVTPTNPPAASITSQPRITAECSAVKAYDLSWNSLTQDQLSKLKAGSKVRFTVSGTASSGSIDKAKFTINNSDIETSTKKPASEEFYIEYQIPNNASQLTVTAKVYHSQMGWY